MRGFCLVLALVTSFFLPGTASDLIPAETPVLAENPRSAPTSIRWYRGSFDKAFEEAAERNVPVVIVALQDKEESSNAVRKDVLTDPGLLKFFKKVIPIICATEDHAEKKTKRGMCCREYGSVTCFMHQAHHEKMYRKFFAGEVLTLPATVFVKPNQEVVAKLHDQISVGAHELAFKRTLKAVGRGLSEGELTSYRRGLTQARNLLAKGDIGRALSALDGLPRLPKGAVLAGKAAKLRKQVIDGGAVAVTKAIELHREGKTLEALMQLEGIAEHLKSLKVGKVAKSSYDKIAKTPEGKAAARDLRRDKKLRKRMSLVDRHLAKKKLSLAIALLIDIRDDGRNLPVGREAEERLAVFKGDKKAAEIVKKHERESEAGRLLDDAKKAKKAKKAEEARKIYERILREYPKTRAGRRAKRQLESD